MSAEHFVSLGMTAEDATGRAALVERVARGFTGLVGAPPEWCWFVPGRIEVLGKHTDYAGGRSLLAAVPRGFAVAARRRNDGLVRLMDVRYGSRTEIDPADDTRVLTGWQSYVQVVARRFARNFPGASLGTDLAIASDLPRAAGLSSSSALVVAVATALARRADLQSRDEWQSEIGSVEDLAWYLGCVENGLDYRNLTGTAGVGTLGGSEDHTAILACRTGCLSQYRFVPVAHQGDTPMPEPVGVRHRFQRRPRGQGRFRARALQPRLPWHARVVAALERGRRHAGGLARLGAGGARGAGAACGRSSRTRRRVASPRRTCCAAWRTSSPRTAVSPTRRARSPPRMRTRLAACRTNHSAKPTSGSATRFPRRGRWR